jgi:two-component system response regulator AtoC
MASTAISSSPLSQTLGHIPPPEIVFGRTRAMNEIRLRLEKIAAANVPVLVEGESGTGKDIISRMIHRRSPWERGPFVKITCPAIPATLLESELFGYEKGAFTGASGTKPGRVEMAHRGTLFLDEISELDMGLQAKLLQLLQEGQFCRIGANEDKKVEVRVVCATNRHLDQEVEEGRFRQDLFYRINVVNLRISPLRERVEDVPDLVNYFIELYNDKYNARAKTLSTDAMWKLQNYNWPGNVRELENVIKRYVILGSEEALLQAIAEQPRNGNGHNEMIFDAELMQNGSMSLKGLTKQAVRQLEKQIILKALQMHNWNRKRTAQALRISYRALLYKIRDAGLPLGRSAAASAEGVNGDGSGRNLPV